jgi:hypothetical protein
MTPADATAELAEKGGALVGLTPERGYGHGCRAAIDRVEALGLPVKRGSFSRRMVPMILETFAS